MRASALTQIKKPVTWRHRFLLRLLEAKRRAPPERGQLVGFIWPGLSSTTPLNPRNPSLKTVNARP